VTISPDDPHSHLYRAANNAVPAGTPPTEFADHLWDDKWWLTIRDAGRIRYITDQINLNPIPNAAQTRAELDELLVKQASKEREDRRADIIEQNSGFPGSFASILLSDPPGNVNTWKVIWTAVFWARQPIMALKYRYKRPRPSQLEPLLTPMLLMPRHAAYPSGHSTQFHLIAHVLYAVTGRVDIKNAFLHHADEVAVNREYAGLHYASDSAAGASLAQQLAPFFLDIYADDVTTAKMEWA
jgi:hypothetical protein